MIRETGGRPDTRASQPDSPATSDDQATCPASAILACLRRPRQERGERRVSAILDAAAALVVELGPDGVTVQALADRARTSKGSLYHFFPDLPSVLRALADRHAAAIGALTDALMADPTVDWRGLSVAQAVQRFLAPLTYLEAHPDLLALARTPVLADQKTRRLTPICDLADHLLRARFPSLPAHERLVRTSTMVAVLDGVVSYGLRTEGVSAHEMVQELSRVLSGYLVMLDAEAALVTSGA